MSGKQNKKTKDILKRPDRRGHFAERIACWWLLLAGYQIVAPRWRAVRGEIDLIAKRRRLFVFVEVKHRFDFFIVNHGKILPVGRIADIKMRGNKRYITLTDESQNATLTPVSYTHLTLPTT